MRELLFRGKSKDGAWVEGLPILIQKFDLLREITETNWGIQTFYHCIEIDNETIGQYTGLKDSAGKRIFEGDIVRNHMGFLQVVIFEEGCFLFIELLDYLYGERQGENFCSCSKKYIDEGVTADVIINNIHDSNDILERYEDLDWNELKELLEKRAN